MKFEWDPVKADRNAAKHGIAFDEAATVFGDPLATTSVDPRFSEEEPRLVTLGHSARRRLIVVAHVERGAIIRIISARSATRRERRIYESGEKDRR